MNKRLADIKQKYKNIIERFPSLEKVVEIKIAFGERITEIEVRPTREMPNISAPDIAFHSDLDYEYWTFVKEVDSHILHEYHKRDNLGYIYVRLVIYANKNAE